MPEPVTMTAILGGAAINIVCGLATNCMEPQRKALWGRVGDWWTKGKTQENHDVLKATHAAYVAAMAKMASAATAIAFTDEERDAAKALTALVANPTFADFRWDAEHLPLDVCQQRIETLFAGRHMPGSEDDGWRTYNRLIVSDLAAWGVDLPPRLAALFIDGQEPHAPWHLAFRHAFAEQLKADEKNPEGERAFRILTFERLNELTANGAVLLEGVAALTVALADVKEDTAAIRSDVAQILVALNAQPAEAERLRAEIATIHQVRPDIDGSSLIELLRQRETERLAQADQLAAMPITDNLVRQHQNVAAEALRDNDDPAAIAALESAEAELAHRREADTRLQADLSSQRAAALLRQLDWRAADAAWHKAVGMLEPIDRRAAESTERFAAVRFLEFGSAFANFEALNVAITRCEILYERASRAKNTDLVGDYANIAGIALALQGERSVGEDSLIFLSRAEKKYKAALKVRSFGVNLSDWADTKNNLANVWLLKGQRDVASRSISHFNKSIKIYESILSNKSISNFPHKWLMAQMNYAVALSAKGEFSSGIQSVRCLEMAISAYEVALRRVDVEESIGHRASIFNNLACTLVETAKRVDSHQSAAFLKRAKQAFQAALLIYNRAETPIKWAASQLGLSLALLHLSHHLDREKNLEYTKQARSACLYSLSVYNFDATPFQFEKANKLLTMIDLRLTILNEISERDY